MFRVESLQPPADAGFPLEDFSTLKMEAIHSSKPSVTQDLHSATSQKMTVVIVSAVKASNLT
jgi:hypothetical protein